MLTLVFLCYTGAWHPMTCHGVPQKRLLWKLWLIKYNQQPTILSFSIIVIKIQSQQLNTKLASLLLQGRKSHQFQNSWLINCNVTVFSPAVTLISKVVEVFLFLHCLPSLIIKLKAFSCLIMLIFVSFISQEIYIKLVWNWTLFFVASNTLN